MRTEVDAGLYDAGGMQLSDPQAERALIGYLIAKPDAIQTTVEAVRADDFFDPFHRRIFETFERLIERGSDIRMATIITALGGDPHAVIFDQVTISQYVAALVGGANLNDDPMALAEHINACAERRAVGEADDVDFDHGRYVPSKFGGMRWEEIGTGGGNNVGYAWLVEGVIPLGEITLVFGDSGTGKSFDIFDMSMAVARGRPFNGFNVEPGLVVYVAAEAGKGFAKRKLAYVLHHGVQPDAAFPFHLYTRRPDFFADDADINALIAEIAGILKSYNVPLVLIVLDTLSALAPGMNENASQDVSRVRARLVKMQERFAGASIVLVHHKPKGGSTPRGHGSLTGDFETTIEFETVPERKSIEGLPVHRATARKQREGKSGISWEFTLPVVKVGINKWGNDETSCAVSPVLSGKSTSTPGFHATPNELVFLAALFDALNDHGEPPPTGLPPSITKAVHIGHVREAMKARMISGEDDQQKADNRFRAAFKRAGDSLRAGSVIGFQNPLIWFTGKPVRGLVTGVTVTP